MKKKYITPEILIVKIGNKQLLTTSLTATGLDGMNGYGGGQASGTADSREFDFDDDEY
jgi:hypothetical protein